MDSQFEAVCDECGDVFLADDWDDVHGVRDNGEPCAGSVASEWVDET